MRWLQDLPIRRKLSIVILLTCTAVLLAACASLAIYEAINFRRAMARDTVVLADILAKNTRAALAFQDETTAGEILQALQSEPHIVGASLYNQDKTWFAGYLRPDATFEFPSAPAADGAEFASGHLEVYRPVFLNEKRLGTIYLKVDLEGLYSRLRLFAIIVGATLAGALLMAYGLAAWMQKPISDPILALAATAQLIAQRKDYSVRALKSGNHEMGALTGAFNEMIIGIQERENALHASNHALQGQIVERQRVEERLRESETRLRVSLETAELGAWELDLKTGMVTLDERSQELFELPGRTAIDQAAFFAIGHPGDETRWGDILLGIVRDEGERADFECRVGASGRSIKASTKRVRDASGGVVRIIGAVQDITALVQARWTMEERRKQLEQLVDERTASLQEAIAQMEEFSFSVSHDLRGPLRAIQAYATAVIEDCQDQLGPQGAHYLQRIVNAGARMDRLTRDVLTYSQVARGEIPLTTISLEQLVADTIEQYKPAALPADTITVEYPLPPVRGHEALLAQAVSNLLANAFKFVAEGVTPRIRIRAERTGADVRLWVEDNGIGIRPEHQAKIWGMFERVHPREKYEGTGIGLAIVRKAVERMGGSIGVESTGENGSRFWIQIPAA